MPTAGFPILRDGEPRQLEITLSPLRYDYQHRAEIEAVVLGSSLVATFGTLCSSIGTAIAAYRALGNLCDLVQAKAPNPISLLRLNAPARGSVQTTS